MTEDLEERLTFRRYRCAQCGTFVKFMSVWSGVRRADDAGRRGDCRRCGLDVDVREEKGIRR
jgi:DNA-directed RNA polymerase subunit RPC12/RpoP